MRGTRRAGGVDVRRRRAPAAEASGGPEIPDVSLTTFEGETTDLHRFVGTPLVVNFWASWCPPCAAEMPDFQTV